MTCHSCPDGRTLRHVRVLTLNTRDGPLDILAEPDGSGGYARLRANAIRATVGGMRRCGSPASRT